jgi:hypothetical protein
MKKLKIYLDTSVISHLYALDTPGKMKDTIKLWEVFKTKNFYDVFLSNKTMQELQKTREPKKTLMTDKLLEITYQELKINEESNKLKGLYLQSGVLKAKSESDAQHIAIASVGDCDVILSWNFKHFVNPKTIIMVNEVNIKNNYKIPAILTPTSIIETTEVI